MLVDDDALFLRLLADNLGTTGYTVLDFVSPHDALAALDRGAPPDLCVLDWDMPDMTGLALLRELRGRGVDSPVLFLTAHGGTLFEETALEAGAVDFVDKTRGPAIIRQRLALALTRGTAQDAVTDQESLQVGALDLAFASKRATWRGHPVPLSRNEFEVIALLASQAGQDVGYRAIYDAVHGPGFVAGQGEDGYRGNVRAIVKRIRRKFQDLDPTFSALGNYAGFGYRWTDDG